MLQPVRPDLFTYSSALRAFEPKGLWQLSLSLLASMQKDKSLLQASLIRISGSQDDSAMQPVSETL